MKLKQGKASGRLKKARKEPVLNILIAANVVQDLGPFRLNPVGETVVIGGLGRNMSQLWTLGDTIAQLRGLIIFKPTSKQVRDNADMVLLRVPASGAYLSECLTGGKK